MQINRILIKLNQLRVRYFASPCTFHNCIVLSLSTWWVPVFWSRHLRKIGENVRHGKRKTSETTAIWELKIVSPASDNLQFGRRVCAAVERRSVSRSSVKRQTLISPLTSDRHSASTSPGHRRRRRRRRRQRSGGPHSYRWFMWRTAGPAPSTPCFRAVFNSSPV